MKKTLAPLNTDPLGKRAQKTESPRPATQPPTEKQIDDFVKAGERVPQGYELRKTPRPSKLRSSEPSITTTVSLPKSFLKKLRMYCVQHEASMSYVLMQGAKLYISSNEESESS